MLSGALKFLLLILCVVFSIYAEESSESTSDESIEDNEAVMDAQGDLFDELESEEYEEEEQPDNDGRPRLEKKSSPPFGSRSSTSRRSGTTSRCFAVWKTVKVCEHGNKYPPRGQGIIDKPITTSKKVITYNFLKNLRTIQQNDNMKSPNGQCRFFADYDGNVIGYNSATKAANFLFTNLYNDNFGHRNGPFKLTYINGKIKILNNVGLQKTIHLHKFTSKTTANRSRLVFSDSCNLRLMDGRNIVWSSEALRRKQVLLPGHRLISKNGKYAYHVTENCQFIIYVMKTNARKLTAGKQNTKTRCEMRVNNFMTPQMIIYDKDTRSARVTLTLNNRGIKTMFVCPDNGQANLDICDHK